MAVGQLKKIIGFTAITFPLAYMLQRQQVNANPSSIMRHILS